MGISNYGAQQILQHILKIAAMTVPTHIYIAASTADPTRTGSGLAEPVGNAYARVQMDNWTWNGGALRAEDASIIQFPTATGSWGTITYVAIYDAASGGNLLFSAALQSAKTINSGDTLSFPIGNFQLSAA